MLLSGSSAAETWQGRQASGEAVRTRKVPKWSCSTRCEGLAQLRAETNCRLSTVNQCVCQLLRPPHVSPLTQQLHQVHCVCAVLKPFGQNLVPASSTPTCMAAALTRNTARWLGGSQGGLRVCHDTGRAWQGVAAPGPQVLLHAAAKQLPLQLGHLPWLQANRYCR